MDFKPKLLPTVIALLEANRGRWPEIARETGVEYRTIQNIVQGVSQNPSVNTVERLHKYLTAIAA